MRVRFCEFIRSLSSEQDTNARYDNAKTLPAPNHDSSSIASHTIAALPPDVRKGFAFPELLHFQCEATPRGVGGAASTAWTDHDGKPEAFRTSEGKAFEYHSNFLLSDPRTNKREYRTLSSASLD